jgi:hypothetical protein
MVPVGTPVRIINEPYKFGISGGKVYLEAHTPLDDQGNPSVVDKHTAVINAMLKREDLANNLRMNWDMVRDVVAAEDGMPVEIGRRAPRRRWSRVRRSTCSNKADPDPPRQEASAGFLLPDKLQAIKKPTQNGSA